MLMAQRRTRQRNQLFLLEGLPMRYLNQRGNASALLFTMSSTDLCVPKNQLNLFIHMESQSSRSKTGYSLC